MGIQLCIRKGEWRSQALEGREDCSVYEDAEEGTLLDLHASLLSICEVRQRLRALKLRQAVIQWLLGCKTLH